MAGLWQLDRRRHIWWQATGLIALLFTLYGLIYRTDTAFIYLIPAWGMAALWLAAGIDWVLSRLADRRVSWGVAVGLLVILPAVADVALLPAQRRRS